MIDRLPTWLRQHIAALRAMMVFTVVLGISYPLLITAIAQIPGLQHRADGSLIHLNGKVVGSAVIGQAFTDANGNPIPKYFQSRPSADDYDPTASGASNLGPESIVDTLPNPKVKSDAGSQSLLTQICARSEAVGALNGVNGRRPDCTADGVGAVLSVIRSHGLTGNVVRVVSVNQACPATPFIASYDGVPVTCATYGGNYQIGKIVPIHGPGKTWPQNPVPPDAVTASGSGLDPDISVAYATLQEPRVARVRGLPIAEVSKLVKTYTFGRALGFMGEPAVNVLQLNLALDRLTGQRSQ
ncbi:MAG TPA: potassium-transporting ATPase subunit C [Mycobacteriales bacterium]|nr:potassium-transporting ATPase subunit C [Mycobacteriales bacterium]